QLVGVDPADVFADYYQMTRSEPMPPVVVARRSRVSREMSPGPWIAVIIVIIVAAASYWWFVVESETRITPGPASEAPIVPEQTVDTSPATEQLVVITGEQAQEEPAPVVSEPLPEPVPAANGETRITLSFSGDCWTEISDATGRRLFFDMGRTGNNVDLTGRAPFAVLFGNAENVSVRVDGNDYPVSASNPGSRTARLTIVKP
ncbi:MAG: DUF4115 domain-containing protein, partial [Gammaproteobacteria bacterium]|nr:DUF4115 domain-containing protein [Gammaproteobacteria bacterium]